MFFICGLVDILQIILRKKASKEHTADNSGTV